ncbi:MAG TPA: alginate lyase family protein [bacterium]|nr:alginate lyase family protein [bacterium]
MNTRMTAAEKKELLGRLDLKSPSLAPLDLAAWPLNERWTGRRLHQALVERVSPRPYLTADDYREEARRLNSEAPAAAAAYRKLGRELLTLARAGEARFWNDTRFDHLHGLGWAAALTGDPAYLRQGEAVLAHHCCQLPPPPGGKHRGGFGWDGLTVGRYLSYATEFLYLAAAAGLIEDEVLARVLLAGHRKLAFTHRHRRDFHFSNITLVGAIGSFFWATLFPEFKDADRYREEWGRFLADNVEIIFRSDGGNYEQSPNYHSVCQYWYAYAWRQDRVNHKMLPDRVIRRLEKSAEFFSALRMPGGELPPVGDTGLRRRDLSLALTALTCGRPDLLHGIGKLPELGWHLGGRFVTADFSSIKPPKKLNYAFPKSGFYPMRSGWKKEAAYALFLCGPHGMFHGHFNLLSLIVSAGQNLLITDPGAYSYDNSPNRLGFLSTPFHSTLSLHNISHRPWEDGQPPLARVTQWEEAGAGLLATAVSRAYDHLHGRPVLTRQFYYDGDRTWIICDRLESDSWYAFSQNFILPQGLARKRVQAGSNLWLGVTGGRGPRLMIAQADAHLCAHIQATGLPVRRQAKTAPQKLCFIKNETRTGYVTLLRILEKGEKIGQISLHMHKEAGHRMRVEAGYANRRVELLFGGRVTLKK